MNILFLLRLWPIYGGGETVTRSLANEFVKMGNCVHVAYFIDSDWRKAQGQLDEHVKNYRIDGVHIDKYGYEDKDAELVQNRVIKYIKDNEIQYVVNQWWPIEYIKGLNEKTGCKLLSVHHMCVYRQFDFPLNSWKNLIKRTFKGYFQCRAMMKYAKSLIPLVDASDKFVFLSKSSIKEFKDWSGYKDDKNKLTYLNNPLTYSNYIDPKEISRKQNIALFVGRIDNDHKRLHYILKAWRQVEKELPDWQLIVVGTGKDYDASVAMSKRLGLKNVCFEGYQVPLPYYQKAKIFLAASHHEGWPMTLTEAQQNGCIPIVMDSYSAVFDIIESGKTGVITKNNDISLFAETIIKVAKNESWRTEMAYAGLESCKRFEVAKIAKQWVEFFGQI